MEIENSRTESLVAQLIYDALETGKFKPHNFPMTDKLRCSCLGVSSTQKLALAKWDHFL